MISPLIDISGLTAPVVRFDNAKNFDDSGIADPEVTFNRDLSGVPQRRQRTHPYRCACREHQLSSTRHNRVQRRKGEYQCLNCNGVLVSARLGLCAVGSGKSCSRSIWLRSRR